MRVSVMVRIASLPDISRFVKREGRLNINNTIHLLVGEDAVEVSGCVISQSSQLLQDLAMTQREIYLDQFTGEIEGIQDVVEMMYGGEVKLNEGNVKTIMKFSVVYGVPEMYELCRKWVEEHLNDCNLFEFIQLGLLIQRVGQDNCDIQAICTEYISQKVKRQLVEVGQDWDFVKDVPFARFLIQEKILQYTLPLLNAWVSNESHVVAILVKLKQDNLCDTVYQYGEPAIDLLDKMSDLTESKDVFKMILSLQSNQVRKFVKSEMKISKPRKDLSSLLSEDYRSLSIDVLLGIEADYAINHAQFVDVAIKWVLSNQRSQKDVTIIWNQIRQLDLCYDMLFCCRRTFLSQKYSVPEYNSELDPREFKYLTASLFLTKATDIDPIKSTNNMACKKCQTQCSFILKLVDGAPGFKVEQQSHCIIGHVYVATRLDPRICLIGFLSLLTNNHSTVRERIDRCLNNKINIAVEVMYECPY